MSQAKSRDKEALKHLRRERAVYVDKAKAKIKTQRKILKAIEEQIKAEDKTILEIAASTQINTSVVLQYISTMRKYGQVVEGEKEGDYFHYQWSN